MLSALIAVIQAAGGTADAKAFASLMEQLFLPTILPFLALVIGSSAIGEERTTARSCTSRRPPCHASRSPSPRLPPLR